MQKSIMKSAPNIITANITAIPVCALATFAAVQEGHVIWSRYKK